MKTKVISKSMERNIKCKALKKTLVDIFIPMVIVFAVIYFFVLLHDLICFLADKYGAFFVYKMALYLTAFFIFIFIFKRVFSYNHSKLSEEIKCINTWIPIDQMHINIPVGRYNLRLKNGDILWDVTESYLINNRQDVVEWMIKDNE